MNNSQADSQNQLARNTFGAMTGVLLSRFSGIIRQQVIAIIFGASASTDAFFVAFRYPNALRDLLADGALSSAFTKTLVSCKNTEAERKLISTVLAFFGLITLALSGLGFIFANEIMRATTSHAFSMHSGLLDSIKLFKILVFYLPLTMLSASAMAILGVHNQTFRATFASAFFNVGTIVGAITLSKFCNPPVMGMAIGAILGGVLQFSFQAIPIYKMGLLTLPKITKTDFAKNSPLREILGLIAPRAISQGAFTLALFINTLLATSTTGNITYISTAQLIILVPVGLFGVATSFSSLPLLTHALQDKQPHKFVSLIKQSINNTIWLSLFSILTFALLAFPLCSILFGHGKYSPYDSYQTALAVSAYSIGILFNSTSKILQQGFFAFGITKQVVINSFVYLIINAALSFGLSQMLTGPVPFGISNSLAAMADFGLNLYFLQKICKKHDFNLLKSNNPIAINPYKIAIAAGIAVAVGLAGLAIHPIIYQNITYFPAIIPIFFRHVIIIFSLGCIIGVLFFGLTILYGPTHIKKLIRKLLPFNV